MVLDSLGIQYNPIDITQPGKEQDREYMKSHCPKELPLVLPPQIFNDEDYCGVSILKIPTVNLQNGQSEKIGSLVGFEPKSPAFMAICYQRHQLDDKIDAVNRKFKSRLCL